MQNKSHAKGRTGMKQLAYAVYLFVAVFVLLEIALRIYNPFHFRLRGDKIMLPINQKIIITNKINPKLDPLIVDTRNSLGLRGAEPPADWTNYLTVITIGGSTTECHFLNDNKTWPYLLGRGLSDSCGHFWLNNAGLDGHSTYGHIVLLNDYIKKLHPKVVVFLTGINDVETDEPTFHDKLNIRGAYPDFRHYIFWNSEVLNLCLNLARGWRAQKFNNTTNTLMVLDSSRRLILSDSVVQKRLAAQAPFIAAYKSRVEQLADTCLAWGILPVFVTQPNQFGPVKDPLTSTDLALFPCEPKDDQLNGGLMWTMLERYNDVVRGLPAEKGIPVIDLAHLMPKNSLYYYDMSHFTNQGAEEVSELLRAAMVPILHAHFPLSCQ
jgi:hypothetical protein